MNTLLPKIGAAILAVCSYIAAAPDSLQGMIPPLVPERYRGLVALLFALAAYTAHQYGTGQTIKAQLAAMLLPPEIPHDHPVLQKPHRRTNHTPTRLIILALAAATLSGCAGVRRDIRNDCAIISHKTTVTMIPPSLTSEWQFVMRPLSPTQLFLKK